MRTGHGRFTIASTGNKKLGDIPLTSRYVVARVVPAEFVALQM